MDNYIKSRDEFIKEEYSKVNQEELNEGIFDFFKTLMKKEWTEIKSKNSNIKQKLEEADRTLNGFTLMKMKNAGTCKDIRQALCDFANTLWEYKSNELEDGKKLQSMLMGLKDKEEITDKEEEDLKKAGEVSKYLKQFDIKDKTLADNLKNYEKKISELCQKNPDLIRWSDLLKNDIRNIVNNMIVDEYEKLKKDNEKAKKAIEKAKEKIKKQEEEQKKKEEEKSKEEEKKSQDAIKNIEKERTKVLSSVGVKPLLGQTGDKAVETLISAFNDIKDKLSKLKESHKYSFDNIINESEKPKKDDGVTDNVKKIIDGDVYFGLKELSKNKNLNNKLVKFIIAEMGVVFNALDELSKGDMKDSIKEVPSDSIQAMFVGLAKSIECALTNEKPSKDVLNLLARCAIDSDKTLGYGLPPMDEKNPDAGNMFTTLMQKLKDAKDEAGVFKKDEDLLNNFKHNMSSIFDEIVKKSKELKEKRQKENEQEAKQAEQEENNE